MVGSPPPFAGLALAFNPTAIPISAIINGPMTLLTITFSEPLIDDPAIDTGNWAVRWNNVNRVVGTGDVTAGQVRLTLTAGGADAGIDRVTFTPPPDDLLTDPGGNPVVAFTDFPVTM